MFIFKHGSPLLTVIIVVHKRIKARTCWINNPYQDIRNYPHRAHEENMVDLSFENYIGSIALAVLCPAEAGPNAGQQRTS
jgi:hypothetical protein